MNHLVNHIERLKYYALRLTKDVNDAKDLIQDLAVKVFSKIDYWEDKTEDEVRKMMPTVLRNLYISQLRGNHKTIVDIYEADTTVENDVWGIMQKRDLQNALLVLSENQRACFRLRLEGYPIKEIQTVLSFNRNNVNQFLMKAKTKLKKQLAA